MRPRTGFAALLIVALLTAGCAGAPNDRPTQTRSDTATATPLPAGSVDFPDGPKDRPARPATLSESSVREYVAAYEYRYVYNSLWMNEYTDVTLDCRVENVTRESWGYAAVATCTGYSNTKVPEHSTLTPGPHADWFTQSYRYRVNETTTLRQPVESRDPAS